MVKKVLVFPSRWFGVVVSFERTAASITFPGSVALFDIQAHAILLKEQFHPFDIPGIVELEKFTKRRRGLVVLQPDHIRRRRREQGAAQYQQRDVEVQDDPR